MLLLGEKHRPLKARSTCSPACSGWALPLLLLHGRKPAACAGAIGVYLPGNWQAPFGIVLVVDRLSALMLVLTGIIGVCAAAVRHGALGPRRRALPRAVPVPADGPVRRLPDRRPVQPVRVLRGDAGRVLRPAAARLGPRAGASGLHYIAINLLASSLFLIGAALIYGVTGTLNMADLALKIPLVPEADRGLLHAGAAILAVAFLAKAAMWPLNFWLVPAYSAASAPVAAMFAIMTKVGVYTVLRLWTLLFSGQAGASAYFGGDWLIYGGMATIVFAALAMLAAQRLERLASLSILVSSGILLAAIGFAQPT